MHNFLWMTFSVHLFWVFVGVAISLGVMMLIGRATGMLLMALFLYNVTVWTAWPSWLPDVFLVAVLASAIGIVIGVFSDNGGTLATFGAATALIIAIWLMTANSFGLSAQVDDLPDGNPGTQNTITQLENDLEDERAKRIENDNDMRRDFDRLSARLEKLEK